MNSDILKDITKDINRLEKKAGNKRWTINNVYQAIIDRFELLAKKKSKTYECFRSVIITNLSNSYEIKIEKKDIVLNILQGIFVCKQRHVL